MNFEVSKMEGPRSDWVKDEDGWKSVVTTPNIPNCTEDDTGGELTDWMADQEELDSPSSDGSHDILDSRPCRSELSSSISWSSLRSQRSYSGLSAPHDGQDRSGIHRF
jgi:hypothetical protein